MATASYFLALIAGITSVYDTNNIYIIYNNKCIIYVSGLVRLWCNNYLMLLWLTGTYYLYYLWYYHLLAMPMNYVFTVFKCRPRMSSSKLIGCWVQYLILFVVGCSRRQYLPDSLQHWLGCVSCLSCLSQHYDKYVIGSGNSGPFMNNLSQLPI